MKCPTCDEILVMTTREGVEIDYCPKCRGVWLDRGELDKIIEKSLNSQYANRDDGEERHHDDYRNDDHHDKPYDPSYKRKKKRGFLSDFFEFD